MMHYSPNQYFRQHNYLRHKELDSLYLSYFIKLFGDSFIGGFTTVYLLSKGYTLIQVCIYFIIYFTVAFLVGFPARLTMKYIGVVKTLGAGILAYILYYFMLQRVGKVSFELVSVFFGVAAGFYYCAFNIELTNALKNNKNEGVAVAVIRIIAVLTSIIGPIAGGIFITQVSFQSLLVIVSMISLVSLLPLFLSKDYKVNLPPFSISRILKLGNKTFALTIVLRGAVEMGIDILWPAFIYMNYQSFITVGGIMSATSLLMTIVIYFAGKYSDLRQADSYRTGVLMHTPTWIIRFLLLSPGGLLLSSVLGSMTAYFIDIPFNKAVYHEANKSGVVTDFFIFTGFFTWIGRIGLLMIAILLPNITLVFSIISSFTFLHLLYLPDLRQKIEIVKTD